MAHCHLAGMFVAGIFAGGGSSLFSPIRPVAAEAAVSQASSVHAMQIMIAEARVTLFNIHPASGPAGAEVRLTGFGFTADNTIYFGPGMITHVPQTSSVGIACMADPNCRGGIKQMLIFTVPSQLTAACPPQAASYSRLPRETVPGEYSVFVENENGKSNELRFAVTGAKTPQPER